MGENQPDDEHQPETCWRHITDRENRAWRPLAKEQEEEEQILGGSRRRTGADVEEEAVCFSQVRQVVAN